MTLSRKTYGEKGTRMTWSDHDDDEERPGLFTSWREFRRALVVFAICSLLWAGMIEAGMRLWHK